MTIHDPSLRAALKTLKLTGMLDTLDARLAQTRDGQLGHLEFLQVLCEDEIARRDRGAGPPIAAGEVRAAGHFRGLRFHRESETSGGDAAGPGRPAMARCRRVGDPLRARWSRQNPCGTSARVSRCPPWRGRAVRQVRPHARRSRRWPCRPHHRSADAGIHPAAGVDHRFIPTPELSRHGYRGGDRMCCSGGVLGCVGVTSRRDNYRLSRNASRLSGGR